MSFRARLTIFFALIVVVPMVAIGVLMFRLIDDSEHGKADAAPAGLRQPRAASIRAKRCGSRGRGRGRAGRRIPARQGALGTVSIAGDAGRFSQGDAQLRI